MKLSIAAAAIEAGVSRQHIYKLYKAGKITLEPDVKGKHVVDSAELYRVFPPDSKNENPITFGNKQLEAENRRLLDQIAEYRDREQRHLAHIDRLAQLLEYRPQETPSPHLDQQPKRGFWGRLFGGAQ